MIKYFHNSVIYNINLSSNILVRSINNQKLIQLAATCNSKLLKFLLKQSIFQNQLLGERSDKHHILKLSIIYNHIDCFEIAISQYHKINYNKCIKLAFMYNSVDIINTIFQKYYNKLNVTLLARYCAKFGNIKIINSILSNIQHKIDINDILRVALDNNRINVVKLLLKNKHIVFHNDVLKIPFAAGNIECVNYY